MPGYDTIARHAYIPLRAPGATGTWSQPTGDPQEWSTSMRTVANLTGRTRARIAANINTAAAAGSTIRAQYSTNSGSTWADLTASLATSAIGTLASAWQAIPAAAIGSDVMLRLVGGNTSGGVTSPVFGHIIVEVE